MFKQNLTQTPTPTTVSERGLRWLASFLIVIGALMMSAGHADAKTHVFNGFIKSSDNPFQYVAVGTDTVIIRDSFLIDNSYEPLINGSPYDGIVLVDGGVINWNSNRYFKLGYAARVILINHGHLRPFANSGDCDGTRTLYFDSNKLASCSGLNAFHSFSDINLAGCISVTGICCNVYMTVVENSGYANDRVLCTPGDSAEIRVAMGGTLNFNYYWMPNLGSGPGPYKVAPLTSTYYSVELTSIFDPNGPEPPYLLSCSGTVQIKINSTINLSATTTAVNCIGAATGAIDLTVSGGTAPYTYLWSNGKTTQDINNLTNTSYTVTVTDKAGCSQVKTILVPVQDIIPPTLTCPGSRIDTTDLNSCTTLTPGINATVTDNCPNTQLTYQLSGATTGNGSGQVTNIVPFATGVTTVKYTAYDGANSVSCTFTVTVKDLQKPTATAPAPITGIQCLDLLPAPDPSVVTNEQDNCGVPTVTFVKDSIAGGAGCPSNQLTVYRLYRIADAANNSIVVKQTLKVADTTPPVFTSIPAALTVSCSQIPAAATVTAADNCNGVPTVTYNGETKTPGACPGNYTLTRKWTATDNCGNTATATQVLTVQDLTPPVFSSVPAAVTVSCDAIPAAGTASATDNCDAAVTITYNGETRTDGACPGTYTLSRQWTATDDCGNSQTASQIITVQDVTKPVFTTVPSNFTVSCDAVPPVGTPVATDNCDAAVTITYDGETIVSGSCTDSYLLKRRWTATDDCGNTQTAEQTLTVRDIVKPVFVTVPASVTVNCDAVPSVGTPTATDNCDAAVTITYSGQTQTPGSCPGSYSLVRRWVATDNCGNSATTSQSITVQDVTPPVFVNVPPTITVNCDDIPSSNNPGVQDNCDENVAVTFLGETRINGACLDSYTLKRKWSATDFCGNVSTAEQTIFVQDITKPVFTFIPAAATVNCDAIPAVGTPIATDNCDATVNINYDGETRTNGACPDSYILKRRWTASDNCGNSRTAEQVLTVQDITAPVFTSVPAAVTVSCDAIPAVTAPAASDNCDAAVTITYNGETRTNGACPDSYTLTRKWTATDNCGNTKTAEQIVTVQDVTAPVFTNVPAAITVSCDAIPSVGTPAAADNCDAAVTITYSGETRTNGACPDSYTLTRKWTATDNCGNATATQQIVTVQDVSAPVFTNTLPNLTVNCESVPSVGTPTATDNCDGDVSIVYNGETRLDGACPNNYTLKRKWTATDNCGNSSTAEQTLTVQDITPPTFTSVPPTATVNCDAVPAVGTPTAMDNCSGTVTILYNGENRVNGACPDSYVLTRKWTATDACGNTKTAEQVLTVQDLMPPTFTFVPAPVTVSCDAIPTVGTPSATDNCTASASILYNGENRINGACPGSYILKRQWTAADNCGNIKQAEQLITVQDVTPPVFTFTPAGITVNCDAIPAVGTLSATDNCDAAVLIQYNGETKVNGACPGTYTLTRKWTATDNCGNLTTTLQVIAVQDVTPPVFTAVPAAVTVNCDAVPAAGAPAATDNCDAAVTITYNGETRIDGACPNTYTLIRKWTATDNCGNATTATQQMSVQDVTPPVFTAVPAATTVSCDAVPTAGTPAATDNCDASVTITYIGETRTDGACPNSYSLLRRWVATDDCGNAQTAEQVLMVADVTPPTFSFVPAATTVSCDAVPTAGAPTATDNCDANVTVTYLGETRTDGVCPDSYTLHRTWKAVDACGNSRTAQQVVSVQDITPPAFIFVPSDTLVDCQSIPTVGNPTAIDNCTAHPTIVYNGEVIVSSTSMTTYMLNRHWTVIDDCGNKTAAVQELSIQDTLPPVIICPADKYVIGNGATCSAIVPFSAPDITDNCSTIPALGGSSASGDQFPVGNSTVTLQATDDSGNTAVCSFKIFVADTTAPVLHNCPPNMTVTSPDDNCFAKAEWAEPVVSDVCDSYTIIAVPDFPSGYLFPTGVTVVNYMAKDTSGNTSVCSFKVTVKEIVPPVLANCPADIVVETDTCTARATWTAPLASDNCQLDQVVSNFQSGDEFPETVTTVTYKAIDVWGNTTTCSFKVTVVDKIAPQFVNCPNNTTVDALGNCSIPVNWTQPTATDNCTGTPQIYSTPAPGSTFPVGHTLVHVFVKDPSGNTDTCVFKVTVLGPPLGFAGTPGNQVLNGCEGIATWTPPVPTGVCGPVTVTSNYAPGDTFQIGTTVVQYTVSDTLGYAATTSFTIKVTEATPPVFQCPVSPIKVDVSGAVVLDPSSFIRTTDTIATCDGVELGFNFPVSTDNCSTPTVTQTQGLTAGTSFPLGSQVLSFLSTDAAGNTAKCTVNVQVLPLYPLQPQISNAIGCRGDDITLIVPNIQKASYIWHGPQPNMVFPDSNMVEIKDLNLTVVGIYTVQANVNGCLTPVDSAWVRMGVKPDAIDDTGLEVAPNERLENINVLLNDHYILDDYTISVVGPIDGLTNLGDGLFNYQAGPSNGQVGFVYEICSAACPDLCDQAIAVITIRETTCGYVPNIITPNNDGINDFLFIPCLETEFYPDNSIVIYNQWGDKVYEAAPYTNDPAKAWHGTLNGEPGRNLPDATYFYVFKPTSDSQGLKGFVEIFR